MNGERSRNKSERYVKKNEKDLYGSSKNKLKDKSIMNS